MAAHPTYSKRWTIADPEANIIVRHVRYSDLRETLAVTIRGETVFDEDSISKAKSGGGNSRRDLELVSEPDSQQQRAADGAAHRR